MKREWMLLSLVFGWLPVAALLAVLMITAHGGDVLPAVVAGLRMMASAAVLGFVVHRLTIRLPWPYPFRARFLVLHLAGAFVFSLAWIVLNVLLASLQHGALVLELGPGFWPYLILGVWLYVMLTGVTYAARAAARTAELEALAARTQLAALRAQLHPHFLFNALHTVMHLIPVDPAAASRVAEQLGDVLRTAIDEQRDVVTLGDELAFVERYLALEAVRFGERLRVAIDADALARSAEVPSFSVQTLVENAVRHGAAASVGATTIRIAARRDGRVVEVTVADDGVGAAPESIGSARGGVARLRERLATLYGGAARLDLDAAPGRGVRATLVVPQDVAMRVAAPGGAAT